jgi:hypothetical protein
MVSRAGRLLADLVSMERPILTKLAVDTRVEAAAQARAAGM